MENSYIERITIALEDIAERLKSIESAMYTEDGAQLTSILDHELGTTNRVLRERWNIYED